MICNLPNVTAYAYLQGVIDRTDVTIRNGNQSSMASEHNRLDLGVIYQTHQYNIALEDMTFDKLPIISNFSVVEDLDVGNSNAFVLYYTRDASKSYFLLNILKSSDDGLTVTDLIFHKLFDENGDDIAEFPFTGSWMVFTGQINLSYNNSHTYYYALISSAKKINPQDESTINQTWCLSVTSNYSARTLSFGLVKVNPLWATPNDLDNRMQNVRSTAIVGVIPSQQVIAGIVNTELEASLPNVVTDAVAQSSKIIDQRYVAR